MENDSVPRTERRNRSATIRLHHRAYLHEVLWREVAGRRSIRQGPDGSDDDVVSTQMRLNLHGANDPHLLTPIGLYKPVVDQVSEVPIEVGLGILNGKTNPHHLLKVVVVPWNP